MRGRQMSPVESRVLMMATLAPRYFGKRKDTWDATDYVLGIGLSRVLALLAEARKQG
ncbi:MAG: hypothetical protein ACHQ0J_13615 [Candidatus Dormibacterales bacterium]